MSIPSAFGRSLASVALLALVGCASVPADLGRKDIDTLVSQRGRTVPPADEGDANQAVAELLSKPLSPESAVRIALVQSPRLQRAYAELGFVAADVYAASRMSNPRLGVAVLSSNVAGEQDQVTIGLALSFTDLLTLPTRNRLAKADYARIKQAIGAEILGLAADVEAAYFRLVGAKQVAALRARAAQTAGLSATLADRFRDAGNFTPRDHALEQAAASEARIEATKAEAEVAAARLALASLLALQTRDDWDVPTELPWPLSEEDDLDGLVIHAGEARLDLAATRARVDVLADRLGVTRWTRWLGDLELGVAREREPDGSRRTGPTLAIEIPVFDQRRDRMLRATAQLDEATIDLKSLALDIENQVRFAYAQVLNARARLIEHRDILVPQREAAVARTQEEVNFMLVGVFELLLAKQQEYNAYQGYLEAARDYWLARVELSRAVGDALPSAASASESTLDLDTLITPEPAVMDHSGHGDQQMMDMEGMEGMEGMDHGAKEEPKEVPPPEPPAKDPEPPAHQGQDGHHGSHGGTP